VVVWRSGIVDGTADDTTAAFSSLMAATRFDLSVVVRLARLPAVGADVVELLRDADDQTFDTGSKTHVFSLGCQDSQRLLMTRRPVLRVPETARPPRWVASLIDSMFRMGGGGLAQPQLSLQFAPVAFLEAIQSRRRCGRAGVDVAVERLVALAHLLPLAHREAVAVAAGDQLLGAELLDELGVDLGQMDEPGRKHRGQPVLADIRALAQVVVELQLGDADRHRNTLMPRRSFLPPCETSMAVGVPIRLHRVARP
jgi:hypothetical protein